MLLPTCSSSAEKWMQKKLHSICQKLLNVSVVKKLYMQLQISSVLIGMRMCTVDPEITVWVLYSMYLCRVVCSSVTAGMDHKCSWCLLLYLPVSKFLDLWRVSFSIWSLVSDLPLQVILCLFNELKNWQDFGTGLWTLTAKQCSLMIFILLRKRWADI
jgi:hypothetical protein